MEAPVSGLDVMKNYACTRDILRVLDIVLPLASVSTPVGGVRAASNLPDRIIQSHRQI